MKRYSKDLGGYFKSVVKFARAHQRFLEHYRSSNLPAKDTHKVSDTTRAKRPRENSGDIMPQKQRKLAHSSQSSEGAESQHPRLRETVTKASGFDEQARDARVPPVTDDVPSLLVSLKELQAMGERLYREYRNAVILPNLQRMETLGFDYDWSVALAGAWTFAHISILRDFYNFPGEEIFPVLANKFPTWEGFTKSSYSKISQLYQSESAPIKAIVLDNIIEYAKSPDMEYDDCLKFKDLMEREQTFALEDLPQGLTKLLKAIMKTKLIKTAYQEFMREVLKDPQTIDEVYPRLVKEQLGRIVVLKLKDLINDHGIALTCKQIALNLPDSEDPTLQSGAMVITFLHEFAHVLMRRKARNFKEYCETATFFRENEESFVDDPNAQGIQKEISEHFPLAFRGESGDRFEEYLFRDRFYHINKAAAKYLLSVPRLRSVSSRHFGSHFEELNTMPKTTANPRLGLTRHGGQQSRDVESLGKCHFRHSTPEAMKNLIRCSKK